MKKKRILKDPNTGEIVGATRTPFSRQAKEFNKQIFSEEFERNQLEEEVPEEPTRGNGFLFSLILLGLSGVGIFIWLRPEGITPPQPQPSRTEVIAPFAQPFPIESAAREPSSPGKKNPKVPVQARVVDESRIQYRGAEDLIFLINGEVPYSGAVEAYWPSGRKSKEFSVLEGVTQGSIETWYENGQMKENFTIQSGKVVAVEVWKPNGEKCQVSVIEKGNGVYVWYLSDGTERERIRYRDGQVMNPDPPTSE
jgi:hypothetical protein